MKLTKMAKNDNSVAERAWSFLRLALSWRRKGGFLKNRVMMELRLVTKFLKGLAHQTRATRYDQISYYKERELSFDDTPIFHVKMHSPVSSYMRFLLPCISVEEVDFDFDFDGDECDGEVYATVSNAEAEEEEEEEKEKGCEEGNIDSKAEKFIVQFYEQMKLQRQVSYLEYAEMLNRGAC